MSILSNKRVITLHIFYVTAHANENIQQCIAMNFTQIIHLLLLCVVVNVSYDGLRQFRKLAPNMKIP